MGKARFPVIVATFLVAISMVGCSPAVAETNPDRPDRIAEAESTESGSALTADLETKKPALTVEDLLSAFPECQHRDTFYETYPTESKPTRISATWGTVETAIGLHIFPDDQDIKSALVSISLGLGSGSVEELSDEQMEPMKRFLHTLYPEWEDSLTWLRGAFSNMQPTRQNYNLQGKTPYSERRENWELRVSESDDERFLMITATQDLGTGKNQATTTMEEIGPRDFEKLIVVNGQSIVKAASVEDGDGKALTKESSEILGIWVSSTWYKFTDVEKKYFIKLHLDLFNEWKGDDKGIVIVFDDYLREELGSGTKYSIKLK